MVFTGFQKSPTELVEYLKDKKPELHYDYDELMHEAHHKAFTVAKVTRLDLLKDIQDSLKNAMDKGIGFEEWKKNIIPTLKEKGWWGKVESVSPSGEIKDIYEIKVLNPNEINETQKWIEHILFQLTLTKEDVTQIIGKILKVV